MNLLKTPAIAAIILMLVCATMAPVFALQPTTGAVLTNHTSHSRGWIVPAVLVLGVGMGLAGTVVLTYNTMPAGPTLGSTVPPTAAQNSGLNIMTVGVTCADADTSIPIVHNWGLPAAYTSALFPICTITLTATGGTVLPIFTVASAANTLTITKVNAAGSSCAFTITLNRPHTAIQ